MDVKTHLSHPPFRPGMGQLFDWRGLMCLKWMGKNDEIQLFHIPSAKYGPTVTFQSTWLNLQFLYISQITLRVRFNYCPIISPIIMCEKLFLFYPDGPH